MIIWSYDHIIILSYHQIIIEAILQMHFPENGTRHFSKNFDKRPGEIAFRKGFRYKSWDVWPNSPKSGMWKFSVHPSENFSSLPTNFFFVFFFVFWRFIALQASYRAQIKTVDRSRRPGNFFKYMLGACAPKKLKTTSAKKISKFFLVIFLVNFFVIFFVFWRFIELQASYRA